LSAVEFVRNRPGDCDHNIVAWAKSELEQEREAEAHQALRTINGVGDKIASMFLSLFFAPYKPNRERRSGNKVA
jgi:3-methyladenine DNA glycosylase/8-oxoguanine DNA glycosylase